MENYINKKYYLPLLEEFYKTAGEDLITCGYDQNPFIPYVFGNYISANRKVFYIGQDTFYWDPKIDKPYNKENILKYLDKNASAMTLEKISSWKNKTSYWGMVVRLQLMLKTEKYYPDITALNDEEWGIVAEAGYGNLNSIELPKTIIKRDECAIKDYDAYYKITKAAMPLQSISGILKAYNPDIIFILSWSSSEDELIKCGFKRHDDLLEPPYRDVYINHSTKQIVVWSNHPSSYSFKSTNMEEMCLYLFESYKKAQKLL